MYATSEQAAEKVVYQVIPIPSEARKLSFVEDPRKEILHPADSVRNGKMRVFPQAVKSPPEL